MAIAGALLASGTLTLFSGVFMLECMILKRRFRSGGDELGSSRAEHWLLTFLYTPYIFTSKFI
jgi:hypothetical protein